MASWAVEEALIHGTRAAAAEGSSVCCALCDALGRATTTVASLGPGTVDGACPLNCDGPLWFWVGRCACAMNCGLIVSASPKPTRLPNVMTCRSWVGAGTGLRVPVDGLPERLPPAESCPWEFPSPPG